MQTASAGESVEQKPAKAKKEPKAGKPWLHTMQYSALHVTGLAWQQSAALLDWVLHSTGASKLQCFTELVEACMQSNLRFTCKKQRLHILAVCFAVLKSGLHSKVSQQGLALCW